MKEPLNRALLVVGLLAVGALAYTASRYWQTADAAQYRRLAADDACDLRSGPCRLRVAGGSVTFAVEPATIPLMQPLRLTLETGGLQVSSAVVDVRGLNMDMGQNRTRLVEVAPGRWQGETILPVCSQRRMEWEAAVRLHAGEQLELPFLFHTERP